MKRNRIQNDPLEGLLAAARRERVPDDGFTQRIMGHIEPVPTSRNSYRIPTFATAFASVMLIVWMALSGFDPAGLTGRLERYGQRGTEIRLAPVSWQIPRAEKAVGNQAETNL